MKFYFLLIIFLSTTVSLWAQAIEQGRVSGQFEDSSLKEIVQQLAADQQLQLFFPNDSLLSQSKSISLDDVLLDQALTQLFKGTQLDYLIYRNFALVVGPRSKLNQSYSAEYYTRFEDIVSGVPETEETIIGNKGLLQPFGIVNLKGKVIDDLTGEEIIGASVVLGDSSSMTITSPSGEFHLQVPTGKQSLIVQYIGYDRLYINLRVYSDDNIEIDLGKNVLNLEEVTIEAVAEDANIESIQVGVTRVDLKGIDKIPVFMGEVDIEKILLLQPGVSKIAEGSSGFNVRGGEVDQNLVMQDEGILLNSSHALGFLSTFNPDMVQSVLLYKGTMPAYYGGRLASVLDVRIRNGDFQRFRLKAGISPITGRNSRKTNITLGRMLNSLLM